MLTQQAFVKTATSRYKILYCSKCSQNFQSDYGKSMHDQNFHKMHIKTKCLFCKKSFFQIQKHILNMHPGSLTPKECKLCGKSFESDKVRRRHWRTHPIFRKCYRQCKFCKKLFKYYYKAMDHGCTR